MIWERLPCPYLPTAPLKITPTEQEPDGLVYEYEDVPTAIQASETPFNCYNTVITVRQEQVVQIIRYWIP